MRFGAWDWKGTVAGCAFLAAIPAAPAFAQADLQPTLVASFRDWFVYTAGEGEERICYALSQPKQSEPNDVNRGPAFFLVSTWQNGDAVNEPSVVPGYPYGEGAVVTIEIGSDTFELFTRNDGENGGAWLEDVADERRLVDAMRRGTVMMVTGTSSRGTLTKDHYSLLGVTAALERVAEACG